MGSSGNPRGRLAEGRAFLPCGLTRIMATMAASAASRYIG